METAASHAARFVGTGSGVELSVYSNFIVVHCTGGEGMGRVDIERRYLRWGASSKRGKFSR